MSHAIDFDGLDEKLFILRHMVHGASSYCATEEIGSKDDAGYQFYDSYWGLLKVLLSNYLIECAVKARMVHEFCAKDDSDGELASYEKEAVGSLSLGSVIEGSFKLTLREASNKIMHATRAIIEFTDIEKDGNNYQAWDGKYHLYGTHGKNNWHVELCVENWAKAMSAFLGILSKNEKTFYMGQDYS